MKTLQVFDRPMCCSTGVCGPRVDPVLPRFAADLDWLKTQGIAVERYNLAQEPGAFAGNYLIRETLAREGVAALPLIVVDGEIVSRGFYPMRDLLAVWAGLAVRPSSAPLSSYKGSCCGGGACC